MKLVTISHRTEPKRKPKPTLKALFESEEAGLLRYAYGLTGRREVAEELVQDVFLQLHQHWDSVETPVAWLYRSVRNRAYNHHRDHRREVLGDADSERRSDPDNETPDSVLQRLETAGHLRLLMEELDVADNELLRLKYYEQLKYREISDRTGLSIGNVGYRLHHILKLLAGKLHKLGIDGVS